MARLPESIEVSVKDIPEVGAALEAARDLEKRHAALVEAAQEMFRRAGPICPDCGEVDPHPADDGTCAALPLRAALIEEDSLTVT